MPMFVPLCVPCAHTSLTLPTSEYIPFDNEDILKCPNVFNGLTKSCQINTSP